MFDIRFFDNGQNLCWTLVIHISLVTSCQRILAKISKSIHVRVDWRKRKWKWNRIENFSRSHVLSEDTFERVLTDDQILISKRLLTKTNKLPRWGERLFSRGSSTIGFILEESICDLKRKTFTTITKNINLKSVMVKEKFKSNLNSLNFFRF